MFEAHQWQLDCSDEGKGTASQIGCFQDASAKNPAQ